jgi:hypothetical protein
MSIVTKKLWELFEVEWMMMRQNPGGSSPYLKGYLLGFAGIINILEALDPAAKTAGLKIKAGSGEVQEQTVNFSAANPGELNPTEAAAALNAAGFTGCSFSVDAETGRLKLAPLDTSVKWIQVYGDLAGALNFGNCRYAQGKGCYLWPSFDGDLKSLAETEQWSEDTTIQNDSPLGTPVKYTKAGNRTGTQIVITDRLSSYAARQMINGGTWVSGSVSAPETYEPPTSKDDEPRRLDVFSYSKIFEKNDNTEGDEKFVRERMYIGCVGHQTRSGRAGSWSDSEYSLTAGTYLGEDGREHASPKESNYTQALWEGLRMSGILVDDWENA